MYLPAALSNLLAVSRVGWYTRYKYYKSTAIVGWRLPDDNIIMTVKPHSSCGTDCQFSDLRLGRVSRLDCFHNYFYGRIEVCWTERFVLKNSTLELESSLSKVDWLPTMSLRILLE